MPGSLSPGEIARCGCLVCSSNQPAPGDLHRCGSMYRRWVWIVAVVG